MKFKNYIQEKIEVDIKVGDIVLGGRFKNKKVKVKEIGKNEKGDITINGRPLLKYRLIPRKEQEVDESMAEWSKKQREKELALPAAERLKLIEKHLVGLIEGNYKGKHTLEDLKFLKKYKPGGFWKRLENIVNNYYHPTKTNEIMKFLRKNIK